MLRLLTFILSLSVITVAGLAAYASFPRECKAGPPPVITVSYESRPVQYDFSKNSAALSTMKSDLPNPYGPNANTETEGLRYDRPTIETKVSESLLEYPLQRLFCIHYDKIDVEIKLKPTIYIASKWPPGLCRDTILGHEEKHIKVDHAVMDEFVPRIRQAVTEKARKIGTLGPLDEDLQDRTQDYMSQSMETAVNSQVKALSAVMLEQQSHVDTLFEYQRVSAICDSGRENP